MLIHTGKGGRGESLTREKATGEIQIRKLELKIPT